MKRSWKKDQVFLPDISHYEWPADLNALADSGCVGVIYKATQDTGYQDPTYGEARAACYAAGMLWGVYHFGEAGSVQGQVDNFLSYSLPTSDDLICLDLEDYGSSTMTLAQAKEWITSVEANLSRPNQCVIYSGNWIKERLGDSTSDPFWSAHRLWLCQYGTSPSWPKAWQAPWLWQFTDGSVGPEPHQAAGVGACDMNAYPYDEARLFAEWSGSGIAPSPPPDQNLIVTIEITAPPGVTVNVQQQQSS